MFVSLKKLAVILSAAGISIGVAQAGVIVSADSATASSEFSGAFDIGNTIDQSGLFTGYTSGVTDFDTYIGSNPLHNFLASSFEWFSSEGVTSATVEYDLGSAMSIDALALWNEEFSGFGTGNISWSLDGIDYFLLTIINPVDSPGLLDYGAQVFNFAATMLRHIRFEISGCPQPDGDPRLLCGIGEVAFRVSDVSEVPIPGAIPLFLVGLAGLRLAKKRRRTA